MATLDLPSQEVLCQLLRYDVETGLLFWRERGLEWFRATPGRTAQHACANWNARYAGQEAFTWEITGYRFGCLTVDGTKEKFAAHRVIWKMEFGVDPDEIDHVSGERMDNRLQNLRDVSRRVNGQNIGISSANKSGHIGVYWNKQRGKWHAKIKIDGKDRHIGFFSDLGEAASARKAAERGFGFHENHGRSAA